MSAIHNAVANFLGAVNKSEPTLIGPKQEKMRVISAIALGYPHVMPEAQEIVDAFTDDCTYNITDAAEIAELVRVSMVYSAAWLNPEDVNEAAWELWAQAETSGSYDHWRVRGNVDLYTMDNGEEHEGPVEYDVLAVPYRGEKVYVVMRSEAIVPE